MDDAHHTRLLKTIAEGIDTWNVWRRMNRDVRIDLSGADLRHADLGRANLNYANLSGADLTRASLVDAGLGGADLRGANLSGAALDRAYLNESANLSGAILSGAFFSEADLSTADLCNADLSRANLNGANLRRADLSGANLVQAKLHTANLSEANLNGVKLSEADLSEANFRDANLSGADLGGANLSGAILVRTDFTNANLSGCRIYGVSAWGLELKGAKQQNLIITNCDEAEITVDNIEVAQFIYLMLHNQKIRDVIDTITSKAVLILGRFTDERKKVLDALREELRQRNYLPILFDFDKPVSRDVTETVSLLARMARFVLADITDAKSIPQELGIIAPDLPSVPVQPLLLNGSGEYGMFEHFRRFPWVLPIYRYDSEEQLIADLSEQVIRPAEIKVLELRGG